MEVEPTFAFDPAPPATIMAGDTGHFRVNIIEVTGSRNRLTTGVTSSAESVVRINLEGDRWRYTGIRAGRAEIRRMRAQRQARAYYAHHDGAGAARARLRNRQR